MTIYLLKKEKNRIYKSEDMVSSVFSEKLSHTDKGAPVLEKGYISITDTKEYWACAFSDIPCGIDMEHMERKVSPNIVKSLHPKEKEYLDALSFGSSEWREEFFSIWTKKESYSKFSGIGLSIGFRHFSVLPEFSDTLETALYTKRFGKYIVSATEDFEIQKISYDAPMNKSALEAGADILDISGCSAKTLKSKLLEKGYSEKDAEEAAAVLLERGYLNDDEYSRSMALKYEKKGYSSKRAAFELERKGVSPELAKEYAKLLKDGDRKRAMEEAYKIVKNHDIDDKIKAKVARKLASLGYDTEMIYDIIQKLSNF